MKSLNKVTLIGNVGSTPEIEIISKDVKVCKLNLATSESYMSKEGEKVSNTEWHRIILWRSLAELAEKYIRKGSLLYIEGKLKTRHYTDASGNEKYVTEIIADEIILLDKKEK